MLRQGGEITEKNTRGCRPTGGAPSTQVVQDNINRLIEPKINLIVTRVVLMLK